MALDRIVPETDQGRADWPRLVAQVVNSHSRALSGLGTTGIVTGTTRTIAATGSVAADDYLIRCDCTAGAITVNLPAAASSAGRVLAVKKVDASANGVTLDGNGAELIDGAATLAWATQYQSYTVICDGTGWNII